MGKAIVIEGLTVQNPLTTVTFDYPVTSITLDKNSISAKVGVSTTLTATVATSDDSVVRPSFVSSNTSVARVTRNGNTATVTGVGSGTCTITVKAGTIEVTCSVVISESATSALSAYYSANSTITQSQKTNLETFVDGLIDAGLWGKVKYLYPFLGTTVADMTIDAVSPSTEDLFAAVGTDGLSVSDGNLISTSRTVTATSVSERASALDVANLSIIAAVTLNASASGIRPIKFLPSGTGYSFGLDAANGGASTPRFSDGVDNHIICKGGSSYLQRIYCATNYNGASTLYKDNALAEPYSESDANPRTPTDFNIGRVQYLLSGGGENGTQNSILVLTEGLSSTEWGTFYTLLLAFLVALGRHS